MKRKAKYIITFILCVLIFFFVYYNLIYFKVDIKLIYQYQDGGVHNTIYLCQTDIDLYLQDEPQYKEILTPLLNSINRDDYILLIIGGGEIETLSMKKNKKNPHPKLIFKKNIPKDTISYYLLKKERYIELYDNYVREWL